MVTKAFGFFTGAAPVQASRFTPTPRPSQAFPVSNDPVTYTVFVTPTPWATLFPTSTPTIPVQLAGRSGPNNPADMGANGSVLGQNPTGGTSTGGGLQPTPVILYSLPDYGRAANPGDREWQEVSLRLSYYFPPYGGINCDVVDGQEECLHIANGEFFYENIGLAVACPPEWEFGTIVQVGDRFYECKDRGGAIVKEDGYYWIDILYPWMPGGYAWGQIIQGWIFLP